MKKIICGIMAIIIAIGMVGCKKNEKTNENGVPTLTWYVPGSQQSDIESVMDAANKILEKEVGARLNMVFLDTVAFNERMTMNMASGNGFDLCFTGYINPFLTAVQRGGLMSLDELLETTPKLKEALPEYYWDVATVNGSIYAVPNQQILGGSNALIVQKELADKYGLDVSKVRSTTDIEPFLEKVRDNEDKIYPFKTSYGINSFSSLDNDEFTYGLVSGTQIRETKDSYVIESIYESDKTIESVRRLNDWYNKGFIRSDVASVTDDIQDLKAGKYAVWMTTYKPGIQEELSASYGFPVYAIPVSTPYVNAGAGRDTMIAIGADSKYPELAVKIIEQMNTNVELYNIISYGIEGKHYEKVGNHIKYIENSGYSPKAAWMFGSQFNAYLIEGQVDDVWEQTKKINDEAMKSRITGYVTDTTPIRTEISQIEAVIGEYSIVGKGAKDPDEYYDEFIAKLKKAGIDKVVSEVSKQVEEFLKNK